jgi:replicative DNA helicase
MNKIRSANLNVNDVKKLSEISDGFWNQPIFINDSPNIFFEEFELAASLMVEQQNVEIIFVDSYEYLREVVDADKEELPFVQRTLLEEYKQAAKDLNIPIVMLMNLPRSDNDEPSISDFKANMIIPRTADVVYFLHRERIKDDRKRCEATLSTGKDVNGRNTYSNLYFYPETGLFKDCTEE